MDFWIHKNGQLAGRFSESDIRAKLADGSFSAADLAWSDAKSAWQPIPEFLESPPATSAQAVTVAPPTEKSADELATIPVETPATQPVEKPNETRAPETSRPAATVKPPPLPTTSTPIAIPLPASRPPPLPSMTSPSVAPGPGSSIPATASIPAAASISATAQPPSGETI